MLLWIFHAIITHLIVGIFYYMLFKLAKYVDTAFFPDTKKAFFKESKNGELKVCYRGRCWSLLSCIFGRGDRYDLTNIFRAAGHHHQASRFFINAKNFVRSPESEEYLEDVLALFNLCRCTSFNFFDEPTLFSEALELSDFFVHEPTWDGPEPQDECASWYYNRAWYEEYALLGQKMADWPSREKKQLNAKNLVSFTTSICELASDWDIALNNMGLKIDLEREEIKIPLPKQYVYILVSSFFRKKPSDHVSRNIDSIFNRERGISTTPDHETIVKNFILLLGDESYTLEEIVQLSDYWECLREEIPKQLLSIFSDSDTFAHKTKFLASFFTEQYSFVGCLVQNLDVLQKLRTKGDDLGGYSDYSDEFDVCYLAPRTAPDFENAIIEFLTNPICCKLTLLEKFQIFSTFSQYYSVFEKTEILSSVLSFFKNRIAKDSQASFGVTFSIQIIVNCLKNLQNERNPLRNLNQKSFCDFLDHFHFSDGCSLFFPVFAAMVLSSDIDWDQLFKSLEMENTPKVKFGSKKLLGNDELIQDFDHFMESVIFGEPKEITSKSELYKLLRCVRNALVEFYGKLYISEGYTEALIKSLKKQDETSAKKIPMVIGQIQNFLLPIEVRRYENEKSIAKLISNMTKIPDTYQNLTSSVIDIARRVSFVIARNMWMIKLRKHFIDTESREDKMKIFKKNAWISSKIQTFLESLYIGLILQERHDIPDDLIFKILEDFMFLRAEETVLKMKSR